jgi:DNA modification methylase
MEMRMHSDLVDVKIQTDYLYDPGSSLPQAQVQGNRRDDGIIADSDMLAAVSADDPVAGYTHNFYRYPARFSPIFVRHVIESFSRPGEVVFDPFMGGGTTIVEALAMGRKALGVDLNTLAHFVTTVKTSPLSVTDTALIREWTRDILESSRRGVAEESEVVKNLPWNLQRAWSDLMAQIDWLPRERHRQFLKCALLKTGQWAIDCKGAIPSSKKCLDYFASQVRTMVEQLDDLVNACREQGTKKNQIRGNRVLLCRSTAGMESESKLNGIAKPTLVVTSPPYPGVHILYHRWQVQGRRETPAPYWITAQKDGHAASHYTFGSRSSLGLENYFRNVQETFESVRKVVASNALIVQLVAFSDAGTQLPRYLEAMKLAGFRECGTSPRPSGHRIWREVPNRKWYCFADQDSAKEVLLFHRPAPI